MATRSVRAYLHNETGIPLIKVSDECPHGEWSRRAPDRVEPYSTAMMRARSSFLGGVESRATYQFGNDASRTLYIHWNNPISGSNAYHTNTSPGTYAFWSAPTSGSDPVAHFFLRPAGSVETDFLPSRDGFRFSNHWDNAPYTLPPLRGTLLDQKYGNADDGLCGGMVLTALDYFVAGQEIPSTPVAPPGEQDPLFVHLVNRLFDTFSVDSVSLMLKLMNPLYPDSDENVLSTFGLANGRAAVMAHQEWPLIRADIDSGKPSPVCIITVKSLNPGDLGKNHQVLAYAYDADGHDITLHVYDPNQPLVDGAYMKFTDGDVSERIVVHHNIAVDGRPIYCFVRMANATRQIPFPTQPRLGAIERRARRVQIVREKQKVLASERVGAGRMVFPVFPDCGEREFPYVIDARKLASSFEVATPYYRNPVVTWRINGMQVAEGSDRRLVVPADAERPDGAPSRHGPTPPSGMVVLHTTLSENKLSVVNEPDDGNYVLSVQVKAEEAGDAATATSRSTTCEIAGFLTTVEGLREANAACWKDYLDRHRAGPMAPGAVADALYAQLGRPPDPLWDPDPTALEVGALVAQADPTFAQVDAWRLELSAPGAQQGHHGTGLGHGGLGAVIHRQGTTIDTTTLDATALADQLRRGIRIDRPL